MSERKCFNALSEYKHILSGGRYFNNVGGPIKDKCKFQTNNKFAIAFKNQPKIGCQFDWNALQQIKNKLWEKSFTNGCVYTILS